MKSILLYIASTLLAAACSVSQQETAPTDSYGLKTVGFGAKATKPGSTKATITPDNKEKVFIADWSDGDGIGIDYSCNGKDGFVKGSWDGSSFTAGLPDIQGRWSYRASYPYSADGAVDLGTHRVQDGASYNSSHDIMLSSVIEADGAHAGRTEDGREIVFPMERQTALAYFHFTSMLDEPVISATLSVTGGRISAEKAEIRQGSLFAENQKSWIDMDVSGQSAKDFTLWFNILPGSFQTMTLTVFTPESHMSITRGAGSFEAGRLYKVTEDLPLAKWQGTGQSEDGGILDRYLLVTSEPSDWSGDYLVAYVIGAKGYIFNGADAAKSAISTSVVNSTVTYSSDMAVIEIAAMDGGYSLKVKNGLNEGKYLSGGTSNGLVFRDTPVAASISLNSDGTVKICNNSTTSLQFNNLSDQMRFRYYKTVQQGIMLFKSYEATQPPVTSGPSVSTLEAQDIGQASATLHGAYTGAVSAPAETGFYWGTSPDNLTNELYADYGNVGSGTFSKTLSSLDPGATYYYRAYILSGGKYYYGDILSFKTAGRTDEKPLPEAYASSWLSGYEIPATDVSLSTDDMRYSGRYCHSSVSERYGDTHACIYDTPSSSQRIVTHTFSYNGKVLPTYTMLYDQDKHCALWEAFEMGGNDYADNNVGRSDAWGYDPAIPSSWQPNLSSAYAGGYTRGHAVASNYRQTTVDENKQTFYYSNMTPQTSLLNSGNWNNLEQAVSRYASQVGGTTRLFIVTGPIFESGYDTTTDKNGMVCPIPTGYYKCLMLCTFDTSGRMNSANGTGYVYNHDGDISKQTMTIDAVEEITGFDFFANVPDVLENAAESSSYRFF